MRKFKKESNDSFIYIVGVAFFLFIAVTNFLLII